MTLCFSRKEEIRFDFFLWFGVLWFGNVLMAMAPFLASAIRRRNNLAFVVFLWVWVLLPLPLPLAFRKGDDARIEYGSIVWIASLFAMALLFTGYYAQGQKNRFALPANRG